MHGQRWRALRSPAITTLGSSVVAAAANFLVVAAIARYLGAAAIGRFAVIVAVVQLTALAASLGLDTSTVYFGGSHASQRSVIARATTWWIVGVGLPTGVFASLLTGLLLNDATYIELLVIALGIPVVLAVRLGEGVLRSQRRHQQAATARVAQGSVLGTGTAVLIVSGGFTADAVLLLWGASWFASSLAQRGASDEHARHTMPSATEVRQWVKRLSAFGLRSHLGLVAQQLNYRADLLLVAGLAGSSAAGLYGMAGRVIDLLWYIPTAASFDLLPRLVDGAGEGEAPPTADASAIRVGVALIGCGAVAWFAAERVFVGVLGPEFRPAGSMLRVLLPGAVLLGVAKLHGQELIALGRPGTNAAISFLTLAIAVPAGLLIIPRHGALGAAWVSTTLYSGQALATWLVVQRRRRVLEG